MSAGVLVLCSHRTTAADRELPDLKVGCLHAYGRMRERLPLLQYRFLIKTEMSRVCVLPVLSGLAGSARAVGAARGRRGGVPAGRRRVRGRPSSGLGQQMAARCPRRAAPKIAWPAAADAAAPAGVYSGRPRAGRRAGGVGPRTPPACGGPESAAGFPCDAVVDVR